MGRRGRRRRGGRRDGHAPKLAGIRDQGSGIRRRIRISSTRNCALF
jgi:hypothetical protein